MESTAKKRQVPSCFFSLMHHKAEIKPRFNGLLNVINLKLNKMEIEKAKEFLKQNGIEEHCFQDSGIPELMAEMMVKFTQQNTLTLESKVDDEGNVLAEPKEHEYDYELNYYSDLLEYNNTPTIKQRLDNEKDLQDIIATQSESIELADKMLRESQDNEKALREGIKELQNKNPYKKAGNRDSYSQYNEGWQDALDYVEQLITY